VGHDPGIALGRLIGALGRRPQDKGLAFPLQFVAVDAGWPVAVARVPVEDASSGRPRGRRPHVQAEVAVVVERQGCPGPDVDREWRR
jgi:hypothetical protein